MYPGVKPLSDVDLNGLYSAYAECSNILHMDNYICSTKLDYPNERRGTWDVFCSIV